MMRLHLLTTLVIVPLAGSLHGQTFEVGWYTVDGGGIMHSTDSQPDGFELSGTIGQHDASSFGTPPAGGPFELVGGFWGCVTATVAGDCDLNGVVDLADYSCFSNCFTGPGAALNRECSSFDFDLDNDVDLRDFSYFQRSVGE